MKFVEINSKRWTDPVSSSFTKFSISGDKNTEMKILNFIFKASQRSRLMIKANNLRSSRSIIVSIIPLYASRVSNWSYTSIEIHTVRKSGLLYEGWQVDRELNSTSTAGHWSFTYHWQIIAFNNSLFTAATSLSVSLLCRWNFTVINQI